MKLPRSIWAMPTFRALKFGYPNARVKAMKSSLLDKQSIEQMIAAGDMRALIAVLEATPYRGDLGEPSIRYSGADLVEFALGKNFARNARKVIKFTPKDSLSIVLTVLEKWDAYNLKTILLGKHLGYSDQEIVPLLVPAGAFSADQLRRMREQKDVESLVSALSSTNYGEPLAPLLPEYKRTKNVQPLIDAVERRLYLLLSKMIPAAQSAEPAVAKLVRAEIDARNIMNVLRGKRDKADQAVITRYFIEGGNISPREFRALVECATIPDVVAKAKNRYDLSAALEAYKSDKSLVRFETELGRKIAGKGLRTLRMSVLSAGALVGYLYLKENEVGNIRKIVRAKEFNMPAEKLRETIIFV